MEFNEILNPPDTTYLDFNIFQKVEKVKEENIFLRNDAYCIYSPIHINEVIRMNNEICENKRLQTISEVCNNRIGCIKSDKMIIANIAPIKLMERSRENRELLKQAEELENISVDDLEVYFEQFMSNDCRKRINSSKENPLNLLKKGDDYYSSLVIQLKYYGDLLEYDLEDLSEIDSFSKRYDYIKGLFKILDLISFRRETDERTRKSSYYDVDHALYASWSKYFITNDSRLLEKAKWVYDFLKIKTQIFTFEDFNNIISIK